MKSKKRVYLANSALIHSSSSCREKFIYSLISPEYTSPLLATRSKTDMTMK